MFLEELPLCTDFKDVFHEEYYRELPEDWLVVATDVESSTRAISEGKYKEVNTIGATCIIACIAACKGSSLCYQFGGDGAFIASPPGNLEALSEALATCRTISSEQFQLGLRTQIWSYQDFKKHGATLKVLKYQIGDVQHLYMFSGNGMELSDQWLKGESPEKGLYDEAKYKNTKRYEFTEGLECRWNPLQSKRGSMVTAIIKPLKSDEKLMDEIYALVDGFGKGTSRLIREENINTSWPPKHYYTEWRVKTGHLNIIQRWYVYFKVMFFVFLVTPIVALLKTKIPYLQELVTQTDFEKFDGSFRFVRDLTSEEFKRLEIKLSDWHEQGKLVYGLHSSSTALMTCMVNSQKDHLHFIDGDEGGYAVAAKQLKSQLQKL